MSINIKDVKQVNLCPPIIGEETAEEAAGKNYYEQHIGSSSGSDAETYRLGAKFGAQWQSTRMYTEQHVIELLEKQNEHAIKACDCTDSVSKLKKHFQTTNYKQFINEFKTKIRCKE